MRYCLPKTYYYVLCRWHSPRGFRWSGIRTPSLGKARYYNKRLPRSVRGIDVRTTNQKPYVLPGSWL